MQLHWLVKSSSANELSLWPCWKISNEAFIYIYLLIPQCYLNDGSEPPMIWWKEIFIWVWYGLDGNNISYIIMYTILCNSSAVIWTEFGEKGIVLWLGLELDQSFNLIIWLIIICIYGVFTQIENYDIYIWWLPHKFTYVHLLISL